MTLLQEIQQAAIDSKVDITTVLRKARLLGSRLKNAEFEEWVQRELNGYPTREDLPPYRILRVESKAHLIFGHRQHFTGAMVMAGLIPEQFRDSATTAYLKSPISEYASLVSSSESSGNSTLEANWPPEFAVKYGGCGYNQAQCLRAWQEIGKDSLVALIETVRNRILEFVVRIDALAPDAGEASSEAPPLTQEAVTQIFNTYVTGGINNIAAGGANISQSHSGQVIQGDLDSLLSYLRNVGISSTSVGELKGAVESGSDKKAAAESWLGKLALTAGNATVQAGVGLAAKAIAHYFGMPV
jgi:AbiTii